MMRFIQNLLSRHMDRDTNVKPRVRGMFEDEPDRVPDVSEETSSVDTQGFSEIESDQEPAQNFWTPKEFNKRTLGESQKQNEVPVPSLKATSKQYEGYDQQPEHGEHVVNSRHQSPQDSAIVNKNNSLKRDDSSNTSQIRYNPKIYLTTRPDETIKDEFKGKNGTDATSESTHSLNDRDGASEKNKKPLSEESSPDFIVSPRQKELMNTPGRPLIQSPSKGTMRQVINVSIGRIEIRASLPPAEVKVPMAKESTGKMSLDQYLDHQKSASR